MNLRDNASKFKKTFRDFIQMQKFQKKKIGIALFHLHSKGYCKPSFVFYGP